MIPRDMKAENAPEGAVVYYDLAANADEVSLEILEGAPGMATGAPDPVRTFTGLASSMGSHRFVWDLRYPGPGGRGRGPRAVPGLYTVRLVVDGQPYEAPLEVLKDRRLVDITVADLQAQFDFLMRAQRSMEALTEAVEKAGGVQEDLTEIMERLEEARADAPWLPGARERADAVSVGLSAVEDALVQTEGGGWDAEAKLRRQINFILSESQTQRGEYTDARPTDQWVERLGDVEGELQVQLLELQRVLDEELAEFNRFLEANGAGVRVIS
jgi:hypothetical protein